MRCSGVFLDCIREVGSSRPSAQVLHDYSSCGNHGNFNASGQPSWVRLPSGHWVLYFNGSTSLIDLVKNDATTDIVTQGCVEAWVNVDYSLPDPELHSVIEKLVPPATHMGWMLALSPTKEWGFWGSFGGVWDHACSTELLEPKTWTKLTVTYEDSLILKFYVNGKLTNSVEKAGPVECWNTAIARIGNETTTTNPRPFRGYLARLKGYSYALSEADIHKEYSEERLWFIDDQLS